MITPRFFILGIKDPVAGLYEMKIYVGGSVDPNSGAKLGDLTKDPASRISPLFVIRGPEASFENDYKKVCEDLRAKADIEFCLSVRAGSLS